MKMETLKTNYCKNGNTNDQRLLCRILLVHSDTLHIKYWFQFSSDPQSCPTLCVPMDCSTPVFSVTNSWGLLKLMPIEWLMPSNHLILCCPLLLLSSIFPSIRVFYNESILHIRWPNYWSFSFSISPSSESSGLISFRIAWLDFLAVQGTLKNLLQHHNSKASILWCSAFCMTNMVSLLSYQHTAKPYCLSDSRPKIFSNLFF